MSFWKTIKGAFTYANTNIPVGIQIAMQVLAFAATVIATISIAPSINEDFEKQKRRSEFYVKTIESLSNDTKDLLAEITVLRRTDIIKDERREAYIEIKKSATKLHWRSVEFALIFDDKRASDDIKKYQKSLEEISLWSDAASRQPLVDQKQMDEAVVNFGLASAQLMHRLAREADVSVTSAKSSILTNIFGR